MSNKESGSQNEAYGESGYVPPMPSEISEIKKGYVPPEPPNTSKPTPPKK